MDNSEPLDMGEKHPLLIWTGLQPGDIVVLRSSNMQMYVGTVEIGTKDGLNIWVRTELNERKIIHFRDCESVQIITNRQDKTAEAEVVSAFRPTQSPPPAFMELPEQRS